MKYPKLRVGYSSHGEWSTIGAIRKEELERGNEFPRLIPCPDNIPAIWVTKTKRKALRYLALAEDWEHIDNPKNPLTPEQKELMEEVVRVRLKPSDRVIWDDGDEGYLVMSNCRQQKRINRWLK